MINKKIAQHSKIRGVHREDVVDFRPLSERLAAIAKETADEVARDFGQSAQPISAKPAKRA